MNNPCDMIGMSVSAWETFRYRQEQRQIRDLTSSLVGYEHEILARGGFYSARVSLSVDALDLSFWIEKGLGLEIRAYNNGGQRVFEGFVDSIDASIGGVQVQVGPLSDIANRVSTVYTPIDYSIYPAATGSETETPIAENTDSQGLYWIIEKIVSGGQLTTAQAEQLRDVFLYDKAYPKRSTPSVSIAPGDASTQIPVTLNVLGYIHALKFYIYNNSTAGVTSLGSKINSIVFNDPNYIFGSSAIDANALLVPYATDRNRFAFDQIEELMTFGNDTTDQLRIYGGYENRLFVYTTPESEIKYRYYLSDPAQRMTLSNGQTVRPWDVRPGCYMFIPDFNIASEPPAASLPTSNDPRVRFIESVRFTAPYSLDLSGAKTDRLSVMLAKLSMGGY